MNLSLSWRLNLAVIAVITVVLALFSARDIASTSKTLSERMDVDISVELEKLQALLPSAIWQYDDEQTIAILNLSIKNSNINAIGVEEKGKLIHAYVKTSKGTVEKAEDTAFSRDVKKAPLSYNREGDVRQLGFVQVAIDGSFVENQRSVAIKNTIFKVLILDICLAVVLYMLTSRLVFKPLNEIAHAIYDIAQGEGDLTRRIRVQGNNEIADLAQDFNRFVSRIHNLMSEVKGAADEVTRTVTLLIQNADSGRESVSKAQRESAHISNAVNSLDSAMSAALSHAVSTENSAYKAIDEASQTGRVVAETTNSIRVLSEKINGGTAVISSLKDDVDSIVKVLDVIRGIADQTNLLALNAAIEAARAGEQGRGFAVVADEVRALASRTQNSTAEIHTMIERLKKGSLDAVHVMQDSANMGDATVKHVSFAVRSLEHISEIMTSIGRANEEISEAMGSQAKTSEGINKGMDNISHLINLSADSTLQLEKSTQGLVQSGKKLSEMVNKFRI